MRASPLIRSLPPVVLALTIPRLRANNLLAPSRGHGRRGGGARPSGGATIARRRLTALAGRGRARVPARDRGRRRRRRRGARGARARRPRRRRRRRRARSRTGCRSASRSAGSWCCASPGTSAPGYVRRGARARAARPGRSCSATTSPAPTRRRRSPGGCSRARTRHAAGHGRPGGRRDPHPPVGAAGRLAAAAGAPRAASAPTPRRRRGRCAPAGVNVTLAPVADVAERPGRGARRPRVLDRLPGRGRGDGRVRRGWREGGVAADRQALPGARRRGHATPTTARRRSSAARSRSATRTSSRSGRRSTAGVPLVMAGHALYPALDGDRIASQSQPIIDGLLRDELGFEGVVITDSTEAAAVQAVTGVQEAAVRNVRAGVDIVLTTGRGSYIQVYRALLAEARRDPAFRERVRESAAARRGAPAVAPLSRGDLDSAQGGRGTASQPAEPRSRARMAPARPRRHRRRAAHQPGAVRAAALDLRLAARLGAGRHAARRRRLPRGCRRARPPADPGAVAVRRGGSCATRTSSRGGGSGTGGKQVPPARLAVRAVRGRRC